MYYELLHYRPPGNKQLDKRISFRWGTSPQAGCFSGWNGAGALQEGGGVHPGDQIDGGIHIV